MPDPIEGVTVTEDQVLFWGGYLSNWYKSSFTDDDGVVYSCTEQYLMAGKARLFKDDERLATILGTPDPRRQKAAGRAVCGYDDAAWVAARVDVCVAGNMLKYEQNAELRRLLSATQDRLIIEASPKDRVWGIGLAAADSRSRRPAD